MIPIRELIDQEKEEEAREREACLNLLLPMYDESLGPDRFALPPTQVRTFINRLSIQEAREVGPKINVAILAANYLRIHGFEDQLANKNLRLIASVSHEHANKRYRYVMAAVRNICESKDPDLHAVIWTLMDARKVLRETTPDLQRAVDLYASRLRLPLV